MCYDFLRMSRVMGSQKLHVSGLLLYAAQKYLWGLVYVINIFTY